MNSVSISQLKARPAKAISQAADYPLAVEKRNQVKAYLVGKELYEKMVAYIEDFIDRSAVAKTDFSKGKDFEKVAKELGL
ncbi:type II toxin-antitoxin system Phd/YefM family antitoxin [Patescibacteria group bacterium]